MSVRMTYKEMHKDVYPTLLLMENKVQASGLDTRLLHLIKIRASQMNGCAYCLDMHFKKAIKDDLDIKHLYSLSAWRETSYFTEEERAALAWTEALTFVADGHVPDAVYEPLTKHFGKSEISLITLAVIAINSWNRLVLSIRSEPGSFSLS